MIAGQQIPDSRAQDSPQARRLELIISYLLRIGVTLSLLIVVAGLVLSFIHHPDYVRSHGGLQKITGMGHEFPHTWGQTFNGLRQFRGEAVVTLGLLLLIATPVMRVAVSLIDYLLDRELVFALITGFVLAMLILSFFLGKAEG